MAEKVGYARVSTREQNPDSQVEKLSAAGCTQSSSTGASRHVPRSVRSGSRAWLTSAPATLL